VRWSRLQAGGGNAGRDAGEKPHQSEDSGEDNAWYRCGEFGGFRMPPMGENIAAENGCDW